MRHVVMVMYGNKRNTIVHAIDDDERTDRTLCGVEVFAKNDFNGNPVSRFGEVSRSLSCGKCIRVMRANLRQQLGALSANEIERTVEFVGSLTGRES